MILSLSEYLWVAGDIIQVENEEEDEEEEKPVAILPPFVARYPKRRPENLLLKQYLAQVTQHTLARASADLRKAGYLSSDQQLHPIDSNSEDLRNEQVQVSDTNNNIWTMEQLKSSLDNCATCNCPHCRDAAVKAEGKVVAVVDGDGKVKDKGAVDGDVKGNGKAVVDGGVKSKAKAVGVDGGVKDKTRGKGNNKAKKCSKLTTEKVIVKTATTASGDITAEVNYGVAAAGVANEAAMPLYKMKADHARTRKSVIRLLL